MYQLQYQQTLYQLSLLYFHLKLSILLSLMHLSSINMNLMQEYHFSCYILKQLMQAVFPDYFLLSICCQTQQHNYQALSNFQSQGMHFLNLYFPVQTVNIFCALLLHHWQV